MILSLFLGILTSIGIIKIKQPFIDLSLNSVKLLDILIDPSEGKPKLDKLESQIPLALACLAKFFGLILLIITPTIILLNLNFDTPDLSPYSYWAGFNFLTYCIGTLFPFITFNISKEQEGYSSLSKVLHRLVLDNYNIGQWLLKRQIKNETLNIQPNAILVTGLARSGTTAITNFLAQNSDLTSLNYSNMPFILNPQLWSKIYKPKSSKNKERAHGDGIKIGLSSIEALEEYFFKVLTANSFIKENKLVKHQLNNQILETYLRYQSSISNGKIYLAKNNNSLLRLDSLLNNKHQLVLILFRSPLVHSHSLLKQHIGFTEIQEKNPFALEYMNWLGHHEFGKNQKSFDFGNNFNHFDSFNINFWLERWSHYYTEALKFSEYNQVLFISYEELIMDPKITFQRIAAHCNISTEHIKIDIFAKKTEILPECDRDLLDAATAIYEKLTRIKN